MHSVQVIIARVLKALLGGMKQTAAALTKEELQKRYGDVPNFDMECGGCLAKFSAPAKDACPEWDAECRMKP